MISYISTRGQDGPLSFGDVLLAGRITVVNRTAERAQALVRGQMLNGFEEVHL